jgi:hypothetical protein
MADACCSSSGSPVDSRALPASNPAPVTCPACGAAGKPVQTQTVRALVATSLRAITGERYRFCATAACPVVYFTAQTGQEIITDQLRELVFQKVTAHPAALVCYCFRHTLHDLRTGTEQQRAAILADITAGIQAEHCACDVRNPQGTCCLGNVRRVIAAAAAEEARHQPESFDLELS